MDAIQVYVSQSLRGAQQFLTAHGDVFAAANSSDARRQLDEAITAVDAAADAQGTLAREVRGEVRLRGRLQRTLVKKYMTPLAKFARASLVGVPEYAALTPSARDLARARLVQAARSMAAAADNHADKLVNAKLPKDFLTQFRAATEAVQQSMDASAARLVARTGATKQLDLSLKDGRRAIAALDAIVSHTAEGDEALKREWRAAKRVRRRSGKSADDASAPAESSPVPGTISPAVPTAKEVTAATA